MKIIGREVFFAAFLAAAVSPIKADERDVDVVLEDACIPVRKSLKSYRVKVNRFNVGS